MTEHKQVLFITPLKNLLIYYLNLPPKEHKTHSRSLNIIQVLFFGTSLDAQLRRRKIDTLILSGVATSNGVYATALDAFQHGYHVIVIEDGCSDRDLELHTLFFEKMFPKTARVRTTKEILQAIEEAR